MLRIVEPNSHTPMMIDVSYAVRYLIRYRAVSFGVALTTSVILGMATSILRLPWIFHISALPYTDVDKLVTLWQRAQRSEGQLRGPLAPGVVLDLVERQGFLEGIAAAELWESSTGAWIDYVVASPVRLRGAFVTPNFFTVLGTGPVLGKDFDSASSEAEVLLSHDTWQRVFAADTAVIGRSITLVAGRGKRRAPRSYLIAGVLPKRIEFTYPEGTEVWLKRPWTELRREPSDAIIYNVIARLSEHVTLASASTALTTLRHTAPDNLKWFRDGERLDIESYRDSVAGAYKRPIAVLGLVGLILLAAGTASVCSTSLLLLERLSGCLTLEMAIGASRFSIAKRAVMIALLPVLTGCVLGIPLNTWLTAFTRARVAGVFPRGHELLGMDIGLLASAALVIVTPVIATVLVFVGRIATPQNTLVEAAHGSSFKSVARARRLILAGQTAVTVALVSVSLLMLQTVRKLNAVSLGFEVKGVHVAQTRLLSEKYVGRDNLPVKDFRRRVIDGLRSSQLFHSVATSSALPFSGTDWVWTVSGPESEAIAVNGRTVDPLFFQSMGMYLKAGRVFDSRDSGQQVIIISEGLAARLFRTTDAVGRTVALGQPHTIVGVVDDVRFVRPSEPPRPAVYVPVEQRESETICFVLRPRSGVTSEQVARVLQETVARVDVSQPVSPPKTLHSVLVGVTADRTFVAFVSVCFAATALCLTVLATSGLAAYQLAVRAKELAIRSAVGADPTVLRWWIIRTEIAMISLGMFAGFGLASLALKLVGPLVYGVSVHSWTVYGGTLFTILIATLSCVFISTQRVVTFNLVGTLNAGR